jgi:hypothetical protein
MRIGVGTVSERVLVFRLIFGLLSWDEPKTSGMAPVFMIAIPGGNVIEAGY